jgi:hypothetical protein
MGKYLRYQRPEYKRTTEVHPIWRGIGCIMFVLVPIMAYAGAELIVRTGVEKGWPLPPELLGFIRFPDWIYKVPVLSDICRWLASYPNLLAVLIFFLVLLLLLSGVFSTVYSIVYRTIGPSRYTAVDAPPPNRKVKQYKR